MFLLQILEEKRKEYYNIIKIELDEIIKCLKIISPLAYELSKPIEQKKLDEYELQLKDINKLSDNTDMIKEIVSQKERIVNELNSLLDEIEKSNVTESDDRNLMNNFKNNENKLPQISVYIFFPNYHEQEICSLYTKCHKMRVKRLYILVYLFIYRITEVYNLKYVCHSEEDAINKLKETKDKEEDYVSMKLKVINDLIKV